VKWHSIKANVQFSLINSLRYLTYSSVRAVFGRLLPGFRSVADLRSSTRLQIAFTEQNFQPISENFATIIVLYLKTSFRNVSIRALSLYDILPITKVNVETSYFTQLKICYLMITFRCPSDILIASWLFTAFFTTLYNQSYSPNCDYDLNYWIYYNAMLHVNTKIMTSKRRWYLLLNYFNNKINFLFSCEIRFWSLRFRQFDICQVNTAVHSIVTNKWAKFCEKYSGIFRDITIFVLGHFILSHPVDTQVRWNGKLMT